jgi:hypothetical protein
VRQWVSRPLPCLSIPAIPVPAISPPLHAPSSPASSLPDSKVVNAFVLYAAARARAAHTCQRKVLGSTPSQGIFLFFIFCFLRAGVYGMDEEVAALFFSPPLPRPARTPVQEASCSESAIHRRSCFCFVLHSLSLPCAHSLSKRKTLHTLSHAGPAHHPPTGSRPRNGARDAPLASTLCSPTTHSHTPHTHKKHLGMFLFSLSFCFPHS